MLVVVQCDAATVLLDVEITFSSREDLAALSQRLAKDVQTYARSGKTVEFGYAFANGARYSASVKAVDAVRAGELEEFVARCV